MIDINQIYQRLIQSSICLSYFFILQLVKRKKVNVHRQFLLPIYSYISIGQTYFYDTTIFPQYLSLSFFCLSLSTLLNVYFSFFESLFFLFISFYLSLSLSLSLSLCIYLSLSTYLSLYFSFSSLPLSLSLSPFSLTLSIIFFYEHILVKLGCRLETKLFYKPLQKKEKHFLL